MSALSEKMRAQREQWVSVGNRRYLLRVPTAFEMAMAQTPVEIALRAVVGWEGVRKSDLVPGDPDDAAPFDADAFREFIADDLHAIKALMDEVSERGQKRAAEIEAARKN